MANKTTSLINKINNKGDECSRWERNWQKVDSGTEKGNWEAPERRYNIGVKRTSGTRRAEELTTIKVKDLNNSGQDHGPRSGSEMRDVFVHYCEFYNNVSTVNLTFYKNICLHK